MSNLPTKPREGEDAGSFDPLKLQLAMKLDGECRLRDISIRNWQKLATEAHLSENPAIPRIREIVERMPGAAITVQNAVKETGFGHPFIDKVTDVLTKRRSALRKCMQAPFSALKRTCWLARATRLPQPCSLAALNQRHL